MYSLIIQGVGAQRVPSQVSARNEVAVGYFARCLDLVMLTERLHLVPMLPRGNTSLGRSSVPRRTIRVNLRIFHVVLNAYRTEKAPDRHSRILLAGIQVLLDPWTPAKNMRG